MVFKRNLSIFIQTKCGPERVNIEIKVSISGVEKSLFTGKTVLGKLS